VEELNAGNLPLAGYRAYLVRLASGAVPTALQARVDLSGVVQQTLLEACGAGTPFEELDEPRRLAWLRTVLNNNIADEVRKQTCQKRDAAQEVSLDVLWEDSIAAVPPPPAEQTSPSQAAVRNEEAARLSTALERLPAPQRQAITLHHVEGLTVAVVAERMGRTRLAIVGLLHRGLSQLRLLLEASLPA